MYNPEIIREFVELRSKGYSYPDLAEALGVSRNTLVAWNKKYIKNVQHTLHDRGCDSRFYSLDEVELAINQVEQTRIAVKESIEIDMHELREIPLLKRIHLSIALNKEKNRLQNIERKLLDDLPEYLASSPSEIEEAVQPEPAQSNSSPENAQFSHDCDPAPELCCKPVPPTGLPVDSPTTHAHNQSNNSTEIAQFLRLPKTPDLQSFLDQMQELQAQQNKTSPVQEQSNSSTENAQFSHDRDAAPELCSRPCPSTGLPIDNQSSSSTQIIQFPLPPSDQSDQPDPSDTSDTSDISIPAPAC